MGLGFQFTRDPSVSQEGMDRSQLRRGIALLMQAGAYAAELKHDPWDFAVEIRTLRNAGLTDSDLRWMICKGYVQHAREITLPVESRRKFWTGGGLSFTRRSCFILTEHGREVAHELNSMLSPPIPLNYTPPAASRISLDRPSAPRTPPPGQTPKWDSERHEFWVENLLVKEFKLPSPNQATILMAFEEEGWPPRIDDPLPVVPSVDPKRRLNNTIKNLNRNQKHRVVRFMGDGTGEGVRWELVSDPRYETVSHRDFGRRC